MANFKRKPIGNFFIKKDLQKRLIIKIVFTVLFATVIFAVTLLITYSMSYSESGFYQVTLNKTEPEIGDRLNIISIILPSLVISCIVNILIGFGIGLYSSRKYAVPIFKLEQWAEMIRDGNLTAKLRFREKEEMQELSNSCNQVSEILRNKLTDIKYKVHNLQKSGIDRNEISDIISDLSYFDVESDTVEVHTNISRSPDKPDNSEG